MKTSLLSLVVPCYNEEKTVAEFYRRASAMADTITPWQVEIIFVNDGSRDKTADILSEISQTDQRVKVLNLACNRGHQIALTAGMDYAFGDVVVTLDGDLQHPPEAIPLMLAKIREGYDVVHAQRRDRRGDTFFKKWTATLFYRLMRIFSGVQLVENSGDFRAFTRQVLEALLAFRTPHRFLRGMFIQLGFRQSVVPFDNEVRFAGETKYSFFKMINLAVDAVLGFSPTPIRIIIFISITLWAISLIHLFHSLYVYYILHIAVAGWTSLIVLLFFFTGLILFSIAIIGSYIGKIFQQGQHQPLYWLSSAHNIDVERINRQRIHLTEVHLSNRILEQQQKDTDDDSTKQS